MNPDEWAALAAKIADLLRPTVRGRPDGQKLRRALAEVSSYLLPGGN